MKIRITLERSLIAAIAAAALHSGSAGAADLLEVYNDAKAHDAAYAAARAAREAGQEKLAQGRAGILPTLNLSAATSRTSLDARYDPPFVPLVPPIDRRHFVASGYALMFTQPLFRRQNFIEYTEADYLVQQSEAAFGAAGQDLILRVAQTYFEVLAAADSLALVQAQKAAIAEQLAQAKKNFEVGTTTITDTHEAQARYDLITAQEITAQSELDLRRRALTQLTGKTYDKLQPLRDGLTLTGPNPDKLESWLTLGENQSYAVVAQQAQVELQALEVKRNNAGHYPTLDFVAAYGSVDQTGTVLTAVGSRASTGIVGLQFNLPLYSGGAVSSRTREAAALLERARADLDNVRRQQALAVQQFFVGVASGINQVRALEQAQISSETALASNRLGYEVGVRVNIDLLNAQQQVYSTRRELAAARYNVILNQLRLKAAVGALGEPDLEEVDRALTP
ncbi:MAG: TolC family outer membrane protein [Sulfurifustis sp.]